MFRVKQLSHAPRHNPQSQTPASQQQTQKSKAICIRFANGQSGIYDKSELKQFSVPSHDVELDFPEITKSQFQIVLSLMSDRKCLHAILPAEAYANPFIYEEMQQAFQQFFPNDFDLVMNLIKKFQMKFLTLEQAKMILKGFEEAKASQDPRIQNLLKQHPQPLAFQEAQTIEAKATFFPKVSDAADHFTHSQDLANELYVCELLLNSLEADLPLAKAAQIPVIKLRISGLKKQIEFCNSKMKAADKIFDPSTMSLMAKQKLLEHLNSDNAFLKEIASNAKNDLEHYRESILAIQKNSGADMSRTDLLEYLVGPKGFLFDYYKLKPVNTAKVNFPYYAFGQSFGYRLENDGPYDFEEEIRSDLSRFTSQLPERLIHTQEVTRIKTKDCEELSKAVIPFLEKFSPESTETKWTAPLHRDMINKLWTYNEWDKLNVSPDNMRIMEVRKDENGMYHVKGQVFLGSEDRLAARPFHFKSHDFILLITDQHFIGTDKVITAEIIKRINT